MSLKIWYVFDGSAVCSDFNTRIIVYSYEHIKLKGISNVYSIFAEHRKMSEIPT